MTPSDGEGGPAGTRFLIVVDTAIDGSTDVRGAEEWYDAHAAEVSRVPGVTRVERYWSVDGVDDIPHHLAIYHVAEQPSVMALRFSQAKAADQLTGSPFPTRTQRAYRLQS